MSIWQCRPVGSECARGSPEEQSGGVSRSSVDHKVQKVSKIELWQVWTSEVETE